MIDQLPHDLVQKIFSLLPTKTVISTSVLCKKCRFLWKSVEKLKFDSIDFESEHQTFQDVVEETLFSLKTPVLRSFHLGFGLEHAHPEDVGEWISVAFGRHLRKLVLEFLTEPVDGMNFTFTSSMCSDTLETLKIKNLILVNIPEPVTMKSLKRLHLIYAFYADEESSKNLLSGCPILEELEVVRTEERFTTIPIITIQIPSLQRLTIYDDIVDDFVGYTIDAPSLEYLKIGELRCSQFSLNAPKLVEADINEVSSVTSQEFRKSLASVQRLFLEEITFENICLPARGKFTHLVYLEMYTCERDWWDLLTSMLQHSPKLQVLKLVSLYIKYNEDSSFGWKWNKPKSVPECLLSHLETFVWKRYDWKKENQEEVATYILENARRLKKAAFATNPIEPNKLNKLHKRRMKLKVLADVVRASKSCDLVFKFERF